MSPIEFLNNWNILTKDTLLIPHYFKYAPSDRWLRIHSLPESKRYANSETEWDILLERQNTLATDIFGENTPVWLIVGEYEYLEDIESYDERLGQIDSLKSVQFKPLHRIDLHAYDPVETKVGWYYLTYYATQTWKSGKFNSILRDIADDQLRVFWVSLERGIIFAPYDGGVDVILPSVSDRNHYKAKYGEWLSIRKDGL
jgi:hypothetical protein